MRAAHIAAGMVAAAGVLAGCGTVAAAPPGGHATGTAHGAAGSAAAGNGRAPVSGSRAEALRVATDILRRARLPAGAHRTSQRLPAVLMARPGQVSGTGFTDVRRVWQVPERMAAVTAFIQAKPPAGMARGSTGEAGGPPGTTMTEADFTARHMPAGIYQGQLFAEVASDGHGGSLVRVDAQVTWYPARSAAERISGMRVVTITAQRVSARPHTIRRTVASARAVAQLAGVLNHLHAYPNPDVALPCPLSAVSYTLAFASSRDARPGIVVQDQGMCEGVRITVDGRDQPALWDPSDRVSATAAHLLGIPPPAGAPAPGNASPAGMLPAPGQTPPAGMPPGPRWTPPARVTPAP